MALRLALHYIPRPSRVHRWDARTKLFGVMAVTGALLFSKVAVFPVAFSGLLGLWVAARLPWPLLLRTFRAWAPFVGLLFIVQAVSWEALLSPEKSIALVVPPDFVAVAAASSARLVLMILWAVLFTATTKTTDVQKAVLWAMHLIPFIPARRIGVMAGLSVHLFATLLDDLGEIRNAERARLGDRSHNPYRRIKTIILPLFRKAFHRAESTALALATRGYRDDVPVEVMPWRRGEMLSCGGLYLFFLALHRVMP